MGFHGATASIDVIQETKIILYIIVDWQLIDHLIKDQKNVMSFLMPLKKFSQGILLVQSVCMMIVHILRRYGILTLAKLTKPVHACTLFWK